jgi:hypothetical protein
MRRVFWVIARKGVYKCFGAKIIHFPLLFLSLGFERKNSLLLLSKMAPPFPLQSILGFPNHARGDQTRIIEASRTRNNKEKGLNKDSWPRV